MDSISVLYSDGVGSIPTLGLWVSSSVVRASGCDPEDSGATPGLP